jgi:uncharacterized integral membrane protein
MLPRHQITLRSILIITAFIALFLGLRRSYVLAGGDRVSKAKQMPPLFAALAVSASLIGSAESRFRRSIILGAIVSITVTTIFTIEITQELRRMGYWNWSGDWPIFLAILCGYACVGGSIGLFTACFHRIWLHFLSVRKTK